MNILFKVLNRLVTARPYATLAFLLLMTVVLVYGVTLRAPLTEGVASTAFLPVGHPLAEAEDTISENFGGSGETSVSTIIFRGETLTPISLTEMDSLLTEMLEDPVVRPVLAKDIPVISAPYLVGFATGTQEFSSLTQAEIDAAFDVPQIGEGLDAITGQDTDSSPVTVTNLTLIETADGRTGDAARRIHEIALAHEGTLTVSTVSPIVSEDEYTEAAQEGMAPLIMLALLLITGLLLLFTRSVADMLLTLAGLVLAIMWTLGAEGWLGPKGLGFIGPPNALTTLVPVIIISLTVDYAIQTISHYREERREGFTVRDATRIGLGKVAVPLTLAAVTTIVSLFAARFSPITVVADFGIVAGVGVALALFVMLTLLPAGRAIIDGRRERRGSLSEPRPISGALPGVAQLAELLGREVTRRPIPYILGVLAVTALLGYAAAQLESRFDFRDSLPQNGTAVRNLETLDSAVGGSTEVASIIIVAEATETRTLLNVHELTGTFADPVARPDTIASPVQNSYEVLLHDWAVDSGQPGDKYDAEIETLYEEAQRGLQLDPILMQQILDRLDELDPAMARVLVNNPDGIDTMLLQFQAYNDDSSRSQRLQGDIEANWYGEDDQVTVTSLGVIASAVSDEITAGQTQSLGTTVAAALIVLSLFFWATLRQPVLAFIAVIPIVLVLIAVFGTMSLIGIPYTMITSIISALSIGIGVDYTIHIIHRYRDEYAGLRNPEQAAIKTLSTTGSALLGSALTTALGFGVLIFSPLLGSQHFGITATITIVYSLIAAVLLVLPAMVVWGAYQNVRLRSAALIWAQELDLEIDATLRRSQQ